MAITPVLLPAAERPHLGANRLSLRSAGQPRWAHLVDLDVFDLESCTRCLLGQIYGTFDVGISVLELDRYGIVACGFDIAPNEGQAELDALTAAWRPVILEARKATAA